MHARPHYLFEGIAAYELSQRIQSQAMDRLKSQNENAILSNTADDLVAHCLAACALRIPELRDEDTYVDDGEVSSEVSIRDYDISANRHGGTRTVTSHIVSFHVPFEGDGNLFNVAPSNRSLPGPVAEIRGQELIIKVATDRMTDGQVRQEYDSRLQSIKQHLSTLSNDLRFIATQIDAPARSYVEERKVHLLKSKNLVASLSFPMKRRAEAPTTYNAPEVRRKVTPAQLQTVAPFQPEPALDEAGYQHILNVMDNMTKVMERSPRAFQKMGQEDIRQHFLVQLNAQYEGAATGETFNFQGKTDILVWSEGRNIFIAECKFRHGEKGLLETIDQLLSYLCWRDTKTAPVTFYKNKNLSGALATIMEAIEKHPQKKRGPTIQSETRFRYIMRNPSDDAREIIVTVMVYDIPHPN